LICEINLLIFQVFIIVIHDIFIFKFSHILRSCRALARWFVMLLIINRIDLTRLYALNCRAFASAVLYRLRHWLLGSILFGNALVRREMRWSFDMLYVILWSTSALTSYYKVFLLPLFLRLSFLSVFWALILYLVVSAILLWGFHSVEFVLHFDFIRKVINLFRARRWALSSKEITVLYPIRKLTFIVLKIIILFFLFLLFFI